MARRIRKRVLMRLYDADADKYELRYGAEQMPKARDAFGMASPRYPVLDVGCGTGILLRELGMMSVGLDISRSMLRIAGSRTRAELVLGDMERMPFRSGSFTTVYSLTAVQLAEDLVWAMSELARVAKDDSAIVVSAHRATEASGELARAAAIAGLHVISEKPPDDSNVDRMILCTKRPQ
ncbi:MAG: class I SAM-dependent methyltransferase [Conexivisphaera sp.]